MKRKLFIILGVTLAVISLGFAVSYAWWAQNFHVQSIDASTTGIVFSYNVDEGSENSKTFNVKNLSFFDIDNEGEGDYFFNMVCVVEVNLTNVCKTDIDIEIKAKLDDVDTTAPYISCVVSDTLYSDEIVYNNKTVLEVISDNSLESSFTITNLSPSQESKVYLYIYGIQPNDGANNDFLKDSYTFKLSMIAIKKEEVA